MNNDSSNRHSANKNSNANSEYDINEIAPKCYPSGLDCDNWMKRAYMEDGFLHFITNRKIHSNSIVISDTTSVICQQINDAYRKFGFFGAYDKYKSYFFAYDSYIRSIIRWNWKGDSSTLYQSFKNPKFIKAMSIDLIFVCDSNQICILRELYDNDDREKYLRTKHGTHKNIVNGYDKLKYEINDVWEEIT